MPDNPTESPTPTVAPPRRAGPSIIRARPRAGRAAGALLAVAFALVVAPSVMAERWAVGEPALAAGDTAGYTVRVPLFLGRDTSHVALGEGAVVIARGQVIADPGQAAVLAALRSRLPSGAPAWLVYLGGLLLCGLLYTAHLRRSLRGRLLRTQLVTLGLIAVTAIGVKIALLLTPVSILIMPVAALALVAAVTVDLSTGLATAIIAAIVVGAESPFDPGVMTLLALQGAIAVLVVGEGRATTMRFLVAGAMAGVASAIAYPIIYFLSWNHTPLAELDEPLRSAWLATLAGGVLAGVVAAVLEGGYRLLLGDITHSRLVALEDLSNPLLKQISEASPGTWQHSLAMANMAEIAANSVGANGRLVRVGAYYHDLGKSLQPKYFVENLTGGEPSPHDALSPSMSCDAIFAHVTEGVRLARKSGLPERIIDFMHMHHGDGVLEFFWAKCQEQGNPDGLTIDDFRYPGIRPHSRETAILAIVDAVEAASRTLKHPDERAIRTLVERIVYGKLHLGQLDDSGLTAADLRRISNALMATIKAAHHGRIEYPWQRQASTSQERTAMERPEVSPTEAQTPVAARIEPRIEPRLDSLDLLRPPTPLPVARVSRALETAATQPVGDGTVRAPSEASSSTASLRRPPTAAEVANSTRDSRDSEAAPAAGAAAASGATAAAPADGAAAASGATAAAPADDDVIELRAKPAAVSVPAAPAPADAAGDASSDATSDATGDATGDATSDDASDAPSQQTPSNDAPPPALFAPLGPSDGAAAVAAPAAAVRDDDQTRPAAERPRVAGSGHRPPPPPPRRRRASDDPLDPGVMVFGPPPGTHPRVARHAPRRESVPPPSARDITVQRHMPIPAEATPPGRRTTAERAVAMPDEAYRDDDGDYTTPTAPTPAIDPHAEPGSDER